MQRSMRRRRLASVALIALAGCAVYGISWGPGLSADAPKQPDPAALERTRATVKLLDDLHKGYVVTITATYVRAQESTPAASVVRKVFAHMEKNGHGSGRLIDATGKPVRPENVARSDFEKKAVEQIKAGKQYFDEVGEKEGKSVLRAATVVPVVMKQCIRCHEHVKEGDVMGALIYEVPIR